jgi:hypothetical protein
MSRRIAVDPQNQCLAVQNLEKSLQGFAAPKSSPGWTATGTPSLPPRSKIDPNLD